MPKKLEEALVAQASSTTREQAPGGIGAEPEQSPTLTADWHNPAVYPINEQIATRDKKLGRGTGLGVEADGDPAFTPLANHPHAVAACSGGGEPITMADLNANTAIGYNMVGTLKVGGDAPSVCQGDMTVRRLTPLECERLQGFPDDWTKIPYRGKPADECPDGPRYKAIGNSMAVPVMRWIGERIAMVEG